MEKLRGSSHFKSGWVICLQVASDCFRWRWELTPTLVLSCVETLSMSQHTWSGRAQLKTLERSVDLRVCIDGASLGLPCRIELATFQAYSDSWGSIPTTTQECLMLTSYNRGRKGWIKDLSIICGCWWRWLPFIGRRRWFPCHPAKKPCKKWISTMQNSKYMNELGKAL